MNYNDPDLAVLLKKIEDFICEVGTIENKYKLYFYHGLPGGSALINDKGEVIATLRFANFTNAYEIAEDFHKRQNKEIK